jgi:transcriptional regulator with XRE-family HTH domain
MKKRPTKRRDRKARPLPATDNDTESIDRDREALADRLRETREFLGLSQQEVADALGPTVGLTRLAVSAIETGRRRVESVELAALARVYGQPLSYFLASRQKAKVEPEEVKFIARAATKMTPGDRAELLRFAEFLENYKGPTLGSGDKGKR